MGIQDFIKWLLPKEDHFFDLLQRGADCAQRAGVLLVESCGAATAEERTAHLERMRTLELESDRIITEVYRTLNKTFVTPIDRSDIYTLASDLEMIVDEVFGTLMQIEVHDMQDLPSGSVELAKLIAEAADRIAEAVPLLRTMKSPAKIEASCNAIGELEERGDNIFRNRIAEMFRTEKDAIRLLKHKEFLEGLEDTLDACDDVANAIQTIAIKNT